MKKMLSKPEMRILILLEMIYFEKKISLNRAVKALRIVTRTLELDIQNINSIIAPISILKTEMNDLILNIPPNYSIEYVYTAMLKNSRHFTVIEKIFFRENYTIDTLADELFISTSTLRRTIKHINTTLEKEKILITMNPLKIIGEEYKICNLLIYLIAEKYPERDKPFSKIQMKTLDQLFFYIAKKNKVKLNYPDIEKIRTWTMVSLIRIRHGHFIFPNKDYEIPIDIAPLNDLMLKNLFKQVFRLDLNNRIIYQLFVVFLNGRYAFSPEHLKQLTETHPEKEILKTEIVTLIKNIALKTGLHDSNTDNLIVDIYNVSNLQFGKPYILYDKYKHFVNNLQNRYNRKLIVTVTNETLLFLKKINVNKLAVNSYMYILFTHWSNLNSLIIRYQPVLNVGIFYNTDMEHMEMIKNEIFLRFSTRFSVEILTNTTIKDFEKSARHKDLIITNISGIEQKTTKVICFSMYPKNTDWENIYRFYDDFLQN